MSRLAVLLSVIVLLLSTAATPAMAKGSNGRRTRKVAATFLGIDWGTQQVDIVQKLGQPTTVDISDPTMAVWNYLLPNEQGSLQFTFASDDPRVMHIGLNFAPDSAGSYSTALDALRGIGLNDASLDLIGASPKAVRGRFGAPIYNHMQIGEGMGFMSFPLLDDHGTINFNFPGSAGQCGSVDIDFSYPE